MEIKYDKSENQRLSSGQAPRPLKIEFSTHKMAVGPGLARSASTPGTPRCHCKSPVSKSQVLLWSPHVAPDAPACLLLPHRPCQLPIANQRAPSCPGAARRTAPALPHPCSFLARPMWPICRQAKVAPRLSRLFEDRFRQIRAFRVSSPPPPHHLTTTRDVATTIITATSPATLPPSWPPISTKEPAQSISK